MRTILVSPSKGGLLALAVAAFLLPERALAQYPYMGPQGNPYGGGIPGGTGNPFYNSGPGYNNNNYNNNRNGNNNNGNPNNGAANYNQGQGAVANQSQTRNRFTLYTSVTGAGVLNSSLDTVTQFGTAVGQNGQQGGGGYGNPYGGGGGNNQYNQTTQNGQGTLLKQPQGVVLNALYNNSTTYGIYGNQQVNQGQQGGQYGNRYGGGYGNPYGGYGNPYKGGYGNGGYGL